MTAPLPNFDLDAVVREVLRRLQVGLTETSASSETGVPRLEQKVITEAVLEAHFSSPTHFSVVLGTILTPSALDWVRRHGVTVMTAAPSDAGGLANKHLGKVAIYADQASPTVNSVLDELRRDAAFDVRDQKMSGDEVADALRHGANGVVIFSPIPERTACDLNRLSGLTAVPARSPDALDAIPPDFRPNVLCLPTLGASRFVLAGMTRAFTARSAVSSAARRGQS